MRDWNLSEALGLCDLLTRENWKQFKYQQHQGNLTYDIDNRLLSYIFGKPMPFRIVKSSGLQTVDIERERMRHFTVCMDLLRSYGYDDYLEQMSQITMDEYLLDKDDQVHIKALKHMARDSRIHEDNIMKQILFQCVYDTVFKFRDEDERKHFQQLYFNEFIIDDLDDRFSPKMKDEHVMHALKLFASNISNRLNKALLSFSMNAPVSSGKHSAMGLKVSDQSYILSHLIEKEYKVWKGIKPSIDLRIRLLDILGYSSKELKKIQFVDDFDIEDLKMFIPKVNAIESTEFKPRVVFQSNDIDDIILDPFMRVLKLMESFCKCSFSTYKPNDERLNSKYSVARMVSNNALDMLNSSESNSDLTKATDKLSGDYVGEMILYTFDNLRPDCRNQLDDLGLTLDYMKACIDLVCHTQVWTIGDNDNIIIGYLRSGHCQGERGSFHMLHFQNMMFGLAAYLKNNLSYNDWELTSIYQGDDGDIPTKVRDDYSNLWKMTSLPGIVSDEKSSSEDEMGALLFCKSWIKTGKPAPKIINGLKFNQFMRIFNDPQMMHDFISFDLFQSHLIKEITHTARIIRSKYKNFGILPNYNEKSYDNITLSRMRRWANAKSLAQYYTMCMIAHPAFSMDILPDAMIGIDDSLTPYNRAKTLVIRNSYLRFDIYAGHIGLDRFTSILSNEDQIIHPLKDVNDYFADENLRDKYIYQGIIPETDYRIPDYIWNNCVIMLMMKGMTGIYKSDNLRSSLEKIYNFEFTGWCDDSHVINIEIEFN